MLFDTLLEGYTPLNTDLGAEGNKEKNDEDCNEAEKTADEANSGEEKAKKKTGCNNNEVVAILAHELGHWKQSHVLKHFVIGQVNFLVT